MSQMHVTKEGVCVYCGAKQVLCPICQRWFYRKHSRHKICKGSCRTRKHRENKQNCPL
jgi:hypothetical protein